MTKLLTPALFVLFCWFGTSLGLSAQDCPEGQSAFSLHVYTDAWGYEMYWELTDTNTDCGVDALYWGGNANAVGCDGEGIEGAPEGSYASNSTFILDTLCAAMGDSLTLHHVDSYGDGGTAFEIFAEGALNHVFSGTGNGNVWTFDPFESTGPAYDSPCAALQLEVNGPMVFIENDSCTGAFGEPAPPVYGCQTNGGWCEQGLAHSAWLTFTATEGNCWVSSCNDSTNFDTQVALWKAEECNDYSTYTLVNANDDLPGGCGPGNGYASGLWTGCLDSGATYLIQVDGWYGAVGQAGITVVSEDIELSVNSSTSGLNCALEKDEEPNGAILLNLTGSGSDYVATWVGPDGFTAQGQQITGLSEGTYSTVILTSCGATLVHTQTLTEPDPINLNLDVVGPSCPEQNDGEAFLSATGGELPYEIQWFGELGDIGNGELLEDLGEGTYSVLLEDNNGCESELPFVLESDDEAFSFTLGPDTTICEDDQLILSAPTGLEYMWSDGSMNQFLVFDATATGTGTFPVTVEAFNEFGCSHADAIFVTVFDCTSSLESTEVQSPFGVMPNPTQNQEGWKVSGPWSGQKTAWTLLDGLGRTVQKGVFTGHTGTQLEVPSNGIESGQYFLQIEGVPSTLRLVRL